MDEVASRQVNQTDDWEEVVKNKNDIGLKQRVGIYDKNAAVYDDIMAAFQYGGPPNCAAGIHKCLKGNTGAKILDVGCGTGLLVKELRKLAPYDNLDGLDPAKKQLERAEAEGLYRNTYNQYFHLNSGIPYNSCDVVASVGAFMPNHLPADAIIEMVNIAKPGGFVVNAAREAYLTDDPDLQKVRLFIQEMVENGKVEILIDELYKNHYDGNNGRVIALKKLK